jgi:hypothetical protein
MKKMLSLLIIIVLILSFSCKKKTDDTSTTTSSQEELTDKPVDNSSVSTDQFINTSVWVYGNEADIGKSANTNKFMEFGNKISIVDNKKIGDKDYSQIQLPDKKKYWVEKRFLSEKFITINMPDVDCYSQPDGSFKVKNIKLQPGDFFNYLGEQDGFIKVSSVSYLPRDKNGAVIWLGEKWLKEGFTEDINVAKDAYQLAQVYNTLYGKNQDKTKAIQLLKDLNENSSSTEISDYTKKLQSELESQ